jgi:hypothetical protein
MATFLEDQTDPWLTARMRQLAQRAEAEELIGTGVFTAIKQFLAIAKAAVLSLPPPEPLRPITTVAQVRGRLAFQTEEEEPLPPPTLDAWPDEQIWLELLATHVIPRVGDVWDIHYGLQTTFDDSRWKFAYLEEVTDRLKIWPAGAFEDVRFELLEGIQQGETIRDLRARVGRSLDIDARSRAAQAQINHLTKIIEDPETDSGTRQAARGERAELYRSMDIEDAEWQWKAARIARTEAMGAMNGGTYAGARVHMITTGEARWKQWWSTTDNRTRDSHWVAHMQVRPLEEAFTVGGYSLQHPGMAGGPAHEVINCRCLMLVLTLEQAHAEQIRYNQTRPLRTNIDGLPMDDAGNALATEAFCPRERRAQLKGSVEMLQAIAISRGLMRLPIGALKAAGGWCAPPTFDISDPERTDVMTQPVTLPAAPADAVTPEEKPLPVGWKGPLAPLNRPSADWRMLLLEAGATPDTRPLPLPFKFQDEQWGGHDGAFGVGLITKVWEQDGLMWGSGPFDLKDGRAAEVARKVGEGYQGWVSVDLDPPRVAEYRWYDKDGNPIDGPSPDGMEVEALPEWRLSSATLVMDQAFPEAKVYPVYDAAELVTAAQLEEQYAVSTAATAAFTVTGDTGLPWAPRDHAWDGSAASQRVAEWAGGVGDLDPARYARAFLYRDPDGDPKAVGSYKLGFADVVDGELRAVWNGVTAAFAATQGARSPLDVPESDLDGIMSKLDALYSSAAKAFDDDTIEPPGQRMALVAAGGPLAAPADWFMYPGFTGPTGWTVTEDGRVFGHAGLFEGVEGATPHIGWYMSGRRFFAPRDAQYDRHNSKVYRVREGYDIGVGLVVIDTNHAPTDRSTTAGQAMDHYANTGARVAYVRAGSDRWGTWVAGTLVPGLTPEQLVNVRALSLSGDWREIDGKVQFICGLGVNVEALHVPRQVTGEDGRILAMVAACPVPPALTFGPPPVAVPATAPVTRYVIADPAEFARAVIAEQDAARERQAEAMALYSRIIGPELDKLAARVKKWR